MNYRRVAWWLPLLVVAILFFVPFFWLKPGEMDLGGDSGRLFFYDPLAYLRTHMLYNVIPSGAGGDALSYYAIPYLLVLVILRSVLSATMVITLFNSFKLAGAFIACYLFVREIIEYEKSRKRLSSTIAAVLAGIFYVFSPILVHSGWDRAILAHIQIVLNPLIAYLLLRYVLTNRFVYMGAILLLTFFFSFNFSFLSAPGFFAFFPITVLLILLYVSRIRRQNIPWKGLMTGAVVFVGIQAFHIMPHLMSLLFWKSQYNAVFSDVGKFTRGLDYFVAIAPSIKVSLSILGLAQLRDPSWWSFLSLVFPASVLVAFFVSCGNRAYREARRTLPVVGFLYLVTLFFVSANITDTGFSIYKSLFYLPGFKMFRNFFAQWSFVYVFFYAVLLGVSWDVIGALRNRKTIVLGGAIAFFILIMGALPLIRGDLVRAFHFESLRIPQVFRMDPSFEKVLSVVKNLPEDGKLLSLPLPGPGYQVVAGKDGGAYVGPSMFSYLTGKNDYTGYDGMDAFGDAFLNAVFRRDTKGLQRLLSILNVRYIFYNSDPAVLESGFPGYPYSYVKDYLPTTQREYRDVVSLLPLDAGRRIDIGANYYIFPVQDDAYLPHIYATNAKSYATYPESVSLNPFLETDPRPAVLYYKERGVDPAGRLILEADIDSPFLPLIDNYHLHRHEPFISRQLDDWMYPLTVIRERFELWRVKRNRNKWIDFQLYYLTKRMLELQRWGELLPVIGGTVDPPRLREMWRPQRYNSWEATLERYEQGMRQFMSKLKGQSVRKSQATADKIKVNEQLDQHRAVLIKFLKSSRRDETELVYLRRITDEMFDRLKKDVDLPVFSDSQADYLLNVPDGLMGRFDVNSENLPEATYSGALRDELVIAGVRLDGGVGPVPRGISRMGSVDITEAGLTPITLKQLSGSRGKTLEWLPTGSTHVQGDGFIARLVDYGGDNTGGLIGRISAWEPRRQYLITFDYRTGGNDVLFRAFEKQMAEKESSVLRQQVFFEKILRADDWKRHQSVLTSNIMTKEGYVQFMNYAQASGSTIEIRNMRVVPITNPKIYFMREPGAFSGQRAPDILFRKINPTLYQIDVSNVSGPYTLVFLEKYDDSWRLVDPTIQARRIRSRVASTAAAIFSPILQRFMPSSTPERTISYFNGSVREGAHRYTVTDPRVFQTWGKKTVSEFEHRRVNGYANAWIVRPEEMQGRSSYTLYIEMRTQKYFYMFALVSVAFFVGLLAFIVSAIRRDAS